MAVKTYVGVSNKARKVKKIYVGISDKARKIKKGYVGVGGIARVCFSDSREVSYYGTLDDLPTPQYYGASASNNNYALFCGGYTSYNGSYVKTVYAYDKNLIRTNAPTLRYEAKWNCGCALGDSMNNCTHALIAGGDRSNGISNIVDAFSTSLVRTNVSNLTVARNQLSAARTASLTFFAGGGGVNGPVKTVDAYKTNLSRVTASTLVEPCYFMGTSYSALGCLFAGGRKITGTANNINYFSNVINVFGNNNGSIVKMTPLMLSEAKSNVAGSTLNFNTDNEFFIFAGGQSVDENGNPIRSNLVDIYDHNFVKLTNSFLNEPRSSPSSISFDENVIFAGGYGLEYYDTVDVFDKNLVHSTAHNLSVGRSLMFSAKIGNYGIFAGGVKRGEIAVPTIDVYREL